MSEGVRHLNVGPVRFVLSPAEGFPLRYEDWAYRGFFRPPGGAEERPAQAELPVRIVAEGRAPPDRPPLYEAGRNWAIWPEADGWWLASGYAGREVPRAACRLAGDFRRATLYRSDGAGLAPLRYPLDQVLTWGLLSRCGGLVLHAAGVVRDGVGFVFAGRSGAGKSTLSALCRAEGWRVLNDDRVLLFRRDGSPRLAGTPWHGTGRFAEADEVPLGGIFLLAQSGGNRLEPLAAPDARLAMLQVASVPWFEESWAQGALDALEGLLREVPVHRFHFTRTPAAVRALAPGVPARRKGVA